MSTSIRTEAEHHAPAPVERDGLEQRGQLPGISQQDNHPHQGKRERTRLSDKEIRRRLRRIHEMALAAANRAHPPQGEDAQ